MATTSDEARRPPRRRARDTPLGSVLVLVGAIAAAVGVGLLPHLVEHGLTFTALVGVVAVLTGLAAVAVGTRLLLRGRRLPTRVLGGVATLIVVLVVVRTVAPPVAATHVPATAISRTPADLGLAYRTVALQTTDGVRLAGWYLPGSNGAGVVLLHGAGSTRSNVLDQARVLSRHGYAVVLVDARGHGRSAGTAMDFGWYGDRDIAAGTRFLAGRPGVERHRIGVLGLSMGGEEAIGAAASDPHIHAVVAEGATGRRADDEAWLSDAYGWRGWAQEQLEQVQYAVADWLTAATPPTPLRTAVAAAHDTRFLLVTAGRVPDEARAARFIRSGAPARVAVWTVRGAGHTHGLATQPGAWERRVVGFLDATLPRARATT